MPARLQMGKEVISAFGDYEQLVGGVDTLFKDSSSNLQEYAANAYKTAGLSANDYMETVTGFSASLIQSLGGDTEKAVEYADMAITDMSDNANNGEHSECLSRLCQTELYHAGQLETWLRRNENRNGKVVKGCR